MNRKMLPTGATKGVSCTQKPVGSQSEVLPWIYLCLALLGFFTNGLVLFYHRKSKRKPKIIFTLNIVSLDIMQCFSLFFRMAYYLNANQWKAEDLMCGVAIFVSVTIFYINVYINMFFLLYVSISRYVTVVRPGHTIFKAFRTASSCHRICQGTCLVIVLVIGSHTVYREIKGAGTTGRCFDRMNNRNKTNSNGMHAMGLVVFYPSLVVMLSSYALLLYHLQWIHKSSHVSQTQGPGGGLRVKRKVLVSVLVFLSCFLPYHIQRSVMILSQEPGNCAREQKNFSIKTYTILVAAFNCCLNPILHLIFNLVCCRGKRLKPERVEVEREVPTFVYFRVLFSQGRGGEIPLYADQQKMNVNEETLYDTARQTYSRSLEIRIEDRSLFYTSCRSAEN